MIFERPELLALAPLLALALSLGLIAQWRRGLRIVDAYGGGEAAARLAPHDLERFPFGRAASLLVGVLLLGVAAAGPSFLEPEPEEEAIDLVVALDLSLSMMAEDVGMSRMRRATDVVARITESLPNDRVAITVFADWPYTLVPMTDDPGLVRFFTDSLSPLQVADRDQGTSMAAVLTHARRTLDARRRPLSEPVILLVSDGEFFGDDAAVLDSVAAASADGVRLWTAGVGSEDGAPLPNPGADGAPMRDADGEPVITRMNVQLLRDAAAAGRGDFYDVGQERGLRNLLADLTAVTGMEDSEEGGPGVAFWMTLLALPFLLWEGLLDSGRRMRRLGRREQAA